MRAENIWWGQIGTSLSLLDRMSRTLQSCTSAVLKQDGVFPWRKDFYDQLDMRCVSFAMERRMMRMRWEEGADPGEYVLKQFCSASVVADYWPGQSYASYLAERNDLVLNDYYVWITDIHREGDLSDWVSFLEEYRKSAPAGAKRAVFVLEYDGADRDCGPLEVIRVETRNYDCRVFCLQLAAELDNSRAPGYQAELALRIGGSDPELNAALLRRGEELLKDPAATALDVLETEQDSAGRRFPPQSEAQIASAAWEGSIVEIFPVLERCRMRFIARREGELRLGLPINNTSGETVEDPYDLDIGPLYYMVCHNPERFSGGDRQTVWFCRECRNQLAHNRYLPYGDVLRLLELDLER